MKTAALRRCLDTVRPALDRRVTIPILSTVKIESRDGALSMLATNLDHSIRVQTQEPYSGEAIAIVGERLGTWVKLQDADEVKLKEQDNGRVTLTCGRGRAQVPTMAISGYPAVEFPASQNVLTMQQRELLRGLKLVAFAISTEESRYTLNGALLEVANGELRLVATDGHRLSLYKMAVEGAPQNSVLLPAGLCKILLGALIDSDESVTISWDDKKIGVLMQREGFGAVEITSLRMTGQFPNYAAVVPQAYPINFTVAAADLLHAVQRSAAFADSRSGAAKCTFQPEGVKILANDAEAGEADDFVEVATGMTSSESIGLNGAYLADALAKMPGDVEVCIKDHQSAVMLRTQPTDTTSLTYVVMPMRI
ncbi:DNA polymerase III subunit beta [Terriglobus sp. ADX1]|uniref:DNA polymerase III subunit beta n=1 Tax=Terriglobus sp. ADX1 TaxID=2794063 RepID=UPI002FE52552